MSPSPPFTNVTPRGRDQGAGATPVRSAAPYETAALPLKGVSLLGSSRNSAGFEQSRIALIASARCLLAAGFGPRNLLLADNGENGAEPLVLDNLGLRDLPQLVESAVSQLDTFVADRQPAIGIIKHAHPLTDRRLGLIGRRKNETTLSYCRVSARDSVRSSFQAKASSSLSSSRRGRCRSLPFAGGLAMHAL